MLTAEQKALRREGIGGSDIAALVGVNSMWDVLVTMVGSSYVLRHARTRWSAAALLAE